MRVRCSRLLMLEGAGLVPGCSTSNVTEHGAEVTLKMLSRYINNNISPLHNCIRAARHQGTAESSTIKCLSSTKLELSTFQQQTFAKIHSVRRGTLLGPFPLKVLNSASTINNLLRHYAKWVFKHNK